MSSVIGALRKISIAINHILEQMIHFNYGVREYKNVSGLDFTQEKPGVMVTLMWSWNLEEEKKGKKKWKLFNK